MRYSFKKQIAVLMALVTVAPCAAFADTRPAADSQPVVIRDVELGQGGTARGRVVDLQGRPAANAAVELHTNAGAHKAVTNQQGDFTVKGLDGGPAVVKVGENTFGARFWSNGTAPPKSLTSFVVVQDDEPVVRGQQNDENRLESMTGLSNGQLLGLGLFGGAVTAVVLSTNRNGSD